MHNKNIRICVVIFALVISVFVLLLGRCVYLQCCKNNYYLDISKKQQQGKIIQKPKRGTILDCTGRVLAASNKVRTIFAEPRIIKDPKETSNELAPIIDIGAHIICKLITESKNPGFTEIKTPATALQCTNAGKIYGIGIQSQWQRYYPMKFLAANIVGFASTDNIGLEGIELRYNTILAGEPGYNTFLADARRRPIRLTQQHSILKDGTGLILTIDSVIQQFARAELIKQYEAYKAEAAIAIVAEPETGAILAIVSLPDFNPNEIANAEPNNFRNRAITDTFEPGSILKPITAAIALDAGVVDYNETIFCENGNWHGKGFGRIGEYRKGFGDLTVREVLIKSSNIGIAKIGQRTGKEKLYKGLRLFGFGRKTGIDLPGEVPGLMWPVKKWNGYSVTRIPFGQEISVTAMQMVRAFCTLANGGSAVKPFVVKAMAESDGQVSNLKQPSPPVGFVVKPQVANWVVTEALTGVVNEGTGKRAKLKKWQVFGKTGTANIAKPDKKGYSDTDYIASFIGGAPAEKPAIVVLVSIRKPDKSLGKGYTGGTVAAPVAGKIIERTLTYLERKSVASASR